MTQQTSAKALSGRALALARRKALSGAGKKAERASALNRTRADSMARKAAKPQAAQTQTAVRATVQSSAPAAAPVSTPQPTTRTRVVRANSNTKRNAALERRKALSTRGKTAADSKDRVRNGQRAKPVAEKPVPAKSSQPVRKDGDCGCGCNGRGDCKDTAPKAAVSSRLNNRSKLRNQSRNAAAKHPGRAASLARRQAQSARGKAGVSPSGMTPAQTARAGNPELSGRELAQALRQQRSKRGGAGQKKSAPTGRVRPNRNAAQGPAKDQPWKVGAGETSHGQTVTGTMVGRSKDVTGDEASTCRGVTGTEYMGADIFRDFCQTEPPKAIQRGGVSPTSSGNSVTGNEVGRSTKVTGDEPGTCKIVTGTEYLGADQSEAFCGVKAQPGPAKVGRAETSGGKAVTGSNVGRSGKVTGDEVGAERTLTGTQYVQMPPADIKASAPAKVGNSATLRGGSVTGTMVGRHKQMTGDEPGSCRNVTGDDYVGEEQFSQFCESTPKPQDKKVGVSATLSGERVTGTMTGRSGRVTGDEPGTCKSVTGTPYAGAEQYGQFCEPEQAKSATARMRDIKRNFGSVMTGIQPSVGGKMTGDEKGACETVSGTPYVGSDQAAEACAATAAEPGEPDFPQSLEGQEWGQFSVAPPMQATQTPRTRANVTGAAIEGGNITGPFGMANGKVTGTEQARFGRRGNDAINAEPAQEAEMVNGRVKSRVTGEGMDAGNKITGDDWDRGDRVTGTEGASALVRNPSQRGPMVPMASALAQGRPEDVPKPVSKVTGSSGNTENGSLITYSGGARG